MKKDKQRSFYALFDLVVGLQSLHKLVKDGKETRIFCCKCGLEKRRCFWDNSIGFWLSIGANVTLKTFFFRPWIDCWNSLESAFVMLVQKILLIGVLFIVFPDDQKQDARSKKQEARSKKQDARCKMQDARCKMREARCEKQDARSKMREARCKMQDARERRETNRCELLRKRGAAGGISHLGENTLEMPDLRTGLLQVIDEFFETRPERCLPNDGIWR